MLALKLGLSLVSTPRLGGWSPDDETSLQAWYQNAVGITLNGSDVSRWDDSATAGLYDMVQLTAGQQPAYSGGVLTFTSANSDNLELPALSKISLSADFTIGIRCFPTSFNNSVLGQNQATGEFFKFTTTSQLRIKIDGSTQNITLDSGTFGDDYLVITRVSNVLTLHQNGTAQSTTPTLAGTADIDAIGVRHPTDTNPYAGTIKEIQIYTSSSAGLTANVNDRLATL
jgi:hypothetical protein